LHAISGSEHGSYANHAEKRLGRLRAELDFGDLDECRGGGLHEFLDRFQAQLNRVGDAIFETFFAPRPIHSTITGAEAQ
jgi:uncharacterized alpha-E superfamily protein